MPVKTDLFIMQQSDLWKQLKKANPSIKDERLMEMWEAECLRIKKHNHEER